MIASDPGAAHFFGLCRQPIAAAFMLQSTPQGAAIQERS
jgi:hypothetical protein